MALQTTYPLSLPKGLVGRRVNAEEWNTITRIATAAIGFGQPVMRSGEDNVTLMAAGTLSAAAVADAGNTGNGAMGTITVAAGTPTGRYRLVIEAAASNAGSFDVFGPGGEFLGNGTVAVAFAGGGLSFTLADGSTDFAVNDALTLTVATTAGRFDGLTEADPGLGRTTSPDAFAQYDSVPVMKSGVMWVRAGGTVTAGNDAYWDSATGKYVNDTTKTRIPNGKFESSGVDTDVVKLRLNLVP